MNKKAKPSPIETHYNGYRFRSRLEARWAVFFNALKVPYQYELEGFDLGITWYLPDFYLTEWDTWIEVKPALPVDEFVDWGERSVLTIHTAEGPTAIAKMSFLKEELNKTKDVAKQHFIFYGTPGVPRIEAKGDKWRLLDGSLGFSPDFIEGEIYLCSSAFALVDGGSRLDIWPYYMDKTCLKDDVIQRHQEHIEFLFANPILPEGFVSRIYFGKGVSYDAPILRDAFNRARQERFGT